MENDRLESFADLQMIPAVFFQTDKDHYIELQLNRFSLDITSSHGL